MTRAERLVACYRSRIGRPPASHFSRRHRAPLGVHLPPNRSLPPDGSMTYAFSSYFDIDCLYWTGQVVEICLQVGGRSSTAGRRSHVERLQLALGATAVLDVLQDKHPTGRVVGTMGPRTRRPLPRAAYSGQMGMRACAHCRRRRRLRFRQSGQARHCSDDLRRATLSTAA